MGRGRTIKEMVGLQRAIHEKGWWSEQGGGEQRSQ